MKRIVLSLIALALAASPIAAQVRIDRNRPAGPAGSVGIENSFGSVKVTGWDRKEVSVKGTLAAGAEGLDLSDDEESIWISVEIPESWLYESDDDTEYRSHLEISVPYGSSVEVESINASITITGVSGEIQVESVNGAVVISGKPAAVVVETMTGSVQAAAEGAPMDIETISGAIVLKGASGSLDVESVSGAVDVTGGTFKEVEIETTSGDVRFGGEFARAEGAFTAETFSGHVELLIPRETAARFHLMTFNGQIENQLGPRPRRDGKFNPFQEVRFSTGLEEYEVSVTTFSGNIKLRTEGTPPATR